MTPDNLIRARLFDYAIGHGLRYGATHNALAAAQVIANRVSAGWHGGDWINTTANAAMVDGTRPHAVDLDLRDITTRQILTRIDDVYAHAFEDIIDGAFYFADLSDVTSDWFRTNILGKLEDHPRVAQIGPVHFFR